ncbi:PEP/pyruvate-binding domain-containing protein [Muriicola jejuensis]|uniref:Phosphoenolpyruvate synthase n=1 Tax=Muriicola jejuensis TaxID=504488 RepID=A0A6P0U7N1_9FLAO|nr:PEP/pyruvate-binding domain-containing protein [Muriicola jejuensis]NER09094.1 phosphoenolpyruvate synthase [Muriicola jejuensis]
MNKRSSKSIPTATHSWHFLFTFFVFGLLTSLNTLWAQPYSREDLAAKVQEFKKDIRGPYKDIRWFCTDGSIRAPKDPCPDNIGPGVQHARYKDVLEDISKKNGIYFGQILAYHSPVEFWDPKGNFSRLKQYQIDQYLRTVDDGWINRKGQYYRGSVQAEDEAAWGMSFYRDVLSKEENLRKYFFLIRNTMKDIPYAEDENLGLEMRSRSKVISDLLPSFMDLRVKIHSSPKRSDITEVERFLSQNRNGLNPDLIEQFNALIGVMKEFHRPFDINSLSGYLGKLKDKGLKSSLSSFIEAHKRTSEASTLIQGSAEFMWEIRQGLLDEVSSSDRLLMLEISLKLEEVIFRYESDWNPGDLREQLKKICHLGLASAASGYMEIWEWEQLVPELSSFDRASQTLEELTFVLERSRSAVEWSTSMFKAHFEEVTELYAGFEPLAHGFIDDRIRGSLVLQLGRAVGELGDYIARESNLVNKVMDLQNQSSVRGLNPGYAMGELVVVEGLTEELEVSSDKIYVFQRPPSDLKPVAGIATVAEGNLVSHVQLLARNLGIPNAALSDTNLEGLRKYNGSQVFYAVSNKGNVILKPAGQMTAEEKALFAVKARKEEKIAVPVEEIRLDVREVLNMRSVDASNSGKLCGPKAANLGQLKKMFPDEVVEGLVIPFGIFKMHMDRPMPETSGSYWDYLNAVFREAEAMRKDGKSESLVEEFQLERLKILRAAIQSMTLDPKFVRDLETSFSSVLGAELGEIPVFLRSDTNMEDLKDFTGAGLNLTIFNTLDREKILKGIKDVWASPYTERSFKWRQKYLLNPENVFPSILVIPSVDVDYSGVMITKGINTGTEKDLTVAFSRGAGGAVDGQAAETRLVTDQSDLLLAPARELYYNRLPETGGTDRQIATFEEPILNTSNKADIRKLASSLREILPRETKSDYRGAYDVELGFKEDKLWLFQIRPFVENKRALGSTYLESITPKIRKDKVIQLSTKR